jgi:DNA-binding MarR family transcriptional regulator
MRDTGLQATQYSILAMLSDGERLSISELADDLGLERTSMSRTLRPMEREGLVALSSEGFRRKRAIELTAADFFVILEDALFQNYKKE